MTKEQAINYLRSSGFSEEQIQEIVKALEQEPNAWSLDDAREDFMHDVYNTLDFLPTNNEANRIIDIFDRVTSGIKQEPILDKIRAEIEQNSYPIVHGVNNHELGMTLYGILQVIDKYKAESEAEK